MKNMVETSSLLIRKTLPCISIRGDNLECDGLCLTCRMRKNLSAVDQRRQPMDFS